MSSEPRRQRIWVTGDLSYDYNIYLPDERDDGKCERRTRFAVTLGGAGISKALLDEVGELAAANKLPSADVGYAFAGSKLIVALKPMAGLWGPQVPGKPVKTSDS